MLQPLQFQLTAPLREPTILKPDGTAARGVSTHGSLAGADLNSLFAAPPAQQFQLTAPLREPTMGARSWKLPDDVSTHGSLAGADHFGTEQISYPDGFNSRLPCGSRRYTQRKCRGDPRFNSRLPCGSRPHPAMVIHSPSGFNSRLPCGSRRQLI